MVYVYLTWWNRLIAEFAAAMRSPCQPSPMITPKQLHDGGPAVTPPTITGFDPSDVTSASSAAAYISVAATSCVEEGARTTGSARVYAFTIAVPVALGDPLVEQPIDFVPGVLAQPDRTPQEEPVGSGPFGF